MISDGLVAQVTNSVRWVQSIQKLLELGVDTFVEVGSGKVLSGMMRRIARDAKCYSTESREAIEKTIEALKSA